MILRTSFSQQKAYTKQVFYRIPVHEGIKIRKGNHRCLRPCERVHQMADSALDKPNVTQRGRARAGKCGGRTCGDQDAALAALELVEGGQPLRLAHLPMDGQGIKAEVAQHQRQLARVVARPREHHECRPRQLCQKVRQIAVLHPGRSQVTTLCWMHHAPCHRSCSQSTSIGEMWCLAYGCASILILTPA